jgi:HSP20 family protein
MAEATRTLDNEKKEIMREDGVERTRNRRVYSPLTDVIETRDHILVVADIPGADEKSVNITLEKNILTIDAFPEPRDSDKYSLIYREYGTGDYQRVFSLSDQIDRDKIEAVVKNGVLYLDLPKASEARAKKITIKAG